MRKDLRAFKNLGKLEWRHVEQPTFCLRMRALCNQVKSTLIPSIHDPFKIQTTEFLDTGKAPVKDEATWKKWWEADCVPQRAQLDACQIISSGALNWLESSECGNPFQRHMLALDAMSIQLQKNDSFKKRKSEIIERSLNSLKIVWSTLTKSMCEHASSPLSFERQIIEGSLPPPSFKFASSEDKIRSEIYESNPYLYEFSEKTRMQYIDSDKYGVFKFLMALLYETKLEPIWLRDIWIMDMATISALMRMEQIVMPNFDYASLGYMMDDFAFWNRLFWDHIRGTITPLIRFGRRQEVEFQGEMIDLVFGIRRRYYQLMRQHGIGFRDIYYLTQPVQVFGAKKLFDHMIMVK